MFIYTYIQVYEVLCEDTKDTPHTSQTGYTCPQASPMCTSYRTRLGIAEVNSALPAVSTLYFRKDRKKA